MINKFNMTLSELLSTAKVGNRYEITFSPSYDGEGKIVKYDGGALKSESGRLLMLDSDLTHSRYKQLPEYTEITFLRAMNIMQDNVNAGKTKKPLYISNDDDEMEVIGIYTPFNSQLKSHDLSDLFDVTFYVKGSDNG